MFHFSYLSHFISNGLCSSLKLKAQQEMYTIIDVRPTRPFGKIVVSNSSVTHVNPGLGHAITGNAVSFR